MMKIEVDSIDDSLELLKPSEIFGADHGEVYRMYDHGEPSDTYFIGTGANDRPICIWFNDESLKWRISSDSKKDLKRFLPHIRVKRCEGADITISLIVN